MDEEGKGERSDYVSMSGAGRKLRDGQRTTS